MLTRWLASHGLVVLTLGAVACEYERVEESATQELRVDTGERAVVEVRVDDGRVDVVGGEPGMVEVIFVNRARAADSAGARALLEGVRSEVTEDGDVVRVSARTRAHAGELTLGGRVWCDVAIRVPPESIDLDIRIDDGRIDIEGVSGAVVADTGDGRIRIANVGGTVKLRTLDGSITGTNLRGDVDVLSEDGRIRLEGVFGRLKAVTADGSVRVRARGASATPKEWSLRTSDGDIELTLPESIDAELDASSADGRVDNRLSRFRGTEHENRVRGALGGGGPRVTITTMDGRIVLSETD
jgi:hypothetical protein